MDGNTSGWSSTCEAYQHEAVELYNRKREEHLRKKRKRDSFTIYNEAYEYRKDSLTSSSSH